MRRSMSTSIIAQQTASHATPVIFILVQEIVNHWQDSARFSETLVDDVHFILIGSLVKQSRCPTIESVEREGEWKGDENDQSQRLCRLLHRRRISSDVWRHPMSSKCSNESEIEEELSSSVVQHWRSCAANESSLKMDAPRRGMVRTIIDSIGCRKSRRDSSFSSIIRIAVHC